MAGPAPLDITIYQGDTFELPLRMREVLANGTLGDYIDLTGSTIKAQVRATKAGSVLAEFVYTPADQTDAATKGAYVLSLSHAVTAALSADSVGGWDAQITYPDGKVRTLLRGKVDVEGEWTR
jgi:hypothetical protein